MESEKVKEIKEELQEEIFIATRLEDKLRKVPTEELEKILNLINELESENERLRKCREVDYKTMTALRQANTELNECMDEMQDRIAKLERKRQSN